MSLALTLKQMRYAEAAGRLGSIARASEAMSISQSSVTAAIDSLEAELGFDIFNRVPAKGLQATPAGLDALRLISRFLSHHRDFETELQAIGGVLTGTIRLACFATAAATFLPPAIERFQADIPGVRFELVEGNMDTVIDFLESGQADLAFSYKEVITDQQSFEPMVDLPHYAMVNAQDPLARQPSVRLADLTHLPMISLSLPRSRAYYSDLFEKAGLSVNVVHTSSSVEMIRTLIASGFGFTILNARPATSSLAQRGCSIVPISDPIPTRPFGIVTQSRIVSPRPVRHFMEHCAALRDEGVFEEMAVRMP